MLEWFPRVVELYVFPHSDRVLIHRTCSMYVCACMHVSVFVNTTYMYKSMPSNGKHLVSVSQLHCSWLKLESFDPNNVTGYHFNPIICILTGYSPANVVHTFLGKLIYGACTGGQMLKFFVYCLALWNVRPFLRKLTVVIFDHLQGWIQDCSKGGGGGGYIGKDSRT